MAMLVVACYQYLQEEQRHKNEHKHNVQNQVSGQMTSYSQACKSLTHDVGHDAEQNHKQVPTRPMQSDQASSRGFAARGLGSFQHHHHVGGGQCDEGNAGHNRGPIVDAIRAGRSAATVNRSHSIVQRCVNCSVREHCNEALG